MTTPAPAQFHWRLEQSNDLEFVVLSCDAQSYAAGNQEAWIAPAWGSNLCQYRVDDQAIITFDPAILKCGDYTGTPVLYPTPNRVRNGIFRHQGQLYPQNKRGRQIVEHGLVHDEGWQSEPPTILSDAVALKTWITFDESSPLWEAFPFQHRLELVFTLRLAGIQITYNLHNLGRTAIPFGFGLHPYFAKLSGEEATFVSLPANQVMDTTGDFLPTGRLIDVTDTIYDLRQAKPIGALDMDHVFTGLCAGQSAEIGYRSLGIKVTMNATPDFSHLVLYSPRGENYFCLEHYTCSTDAHNLSDHGFIAESGLRLAPPGETTSGSVNYLVTKETQK